MVVAWAIVAVLLAGNWVYAEIMKARTEAYIANARAETAQYRADQLQRVLEAREARGD
jgi:hypothetical protein